MKRFSKIATLALVLFGTTSSAYAENIEIAAPAFVQQCPCNGGEPKVVNGVLMPTDRTKVYAGLNFPDAANGQKICFLSMIYQDTNGNANMTARLLRKSWQVEGNAMREPRVIAEVKSEPGTVNTVRMATVLLDGAPIDEDTGFYYVEVSMPAIDLNLLGVKINYDDFCVF